MSLPSAPKPAKLFMAVLFAPGAPLEDLERRLRLEFGEIDLRLPPFPFAHSDYYKAEMGGDLKKVFWSFEPVIAADALPGFKLHTNRIERHYSGGETGHRTLNIDPGYLDHARVVLATGKDYAHRLYLGRGIFGEVTLIYHKDAGYEPMPWTYPDYREAAVLGFFGEMREKWNKQAVGGRREERL